MKGGVGSREGEWDFHLDGGSTLEVPYGGRVARGSEE